LNLGPGTKKSWRQSTSQAAPGRGYQPNFSDLKYD
jgi:hypothetical protein